MALPSLIIKFSTPKAAPRVAPSASTTEASLPTVKVEPAPDKVNFLLKVHLPEVTEALPPEIKTSDATVPPVPKPVLTLPLVDTPPNSNLASEPDTVIPFSELVSKPLVTT